MPSELSAYRSHSENTDKSRIWTRSVRLLPLSTLSPSQIRMLLLYISGPYKKASRKLNYQILTQLRYSIPVHKCSWEKFFLVLTAKTLEFFVLVDKESFLFSVVHVFTETMNHWHLSQSRFLARDLRALGSATGWDPAASLLCLHSPRTSWHYCHFSNQLLCNPFFWKFLIFCLLFQVHLNPTWKLTGVENISRSNKAAYLWLCNGIVVHWWSLLIFSKSLTRTVKTYFSLSQHARRCKWYEW